MRKILLSFGLFTMIYVGLVLLAFLMAKVIDRDIKTVKPPKPTPTVEVVSDDEPICGSGSFSGEVAK